MTADQADHTGNTGDSAGHETGDDIRGGAGQEPARDVPAPTADTADVVIVHTLQDGTVVYGTRRGDGTGRILHSNGFRPSGNLADHPDHGPAHWYIPHSRRNRAKQWTINQVTEALTAAGYTVWVDVDNVTLPTVPFAELEAERYGRAEDRADRFAGYAENATGRGEAAWNQVSEERGRIPLGQPVMPGHHSYARDMAQRRRWDAKEERAVGDMRRGKQWAARADTAGQFRAGRENLETTLNRIERHQAEVRKLQRNLATATTDLYRAELTSLITLREEEIAYWQAHVDQARAEAGVKVWGPDDFTRGDYVDIGGVYAEVVRVNTKTLTLAWGRVEPGQRVLTAAEVAARHGGKPLTEKLPYNKVRGRKTAAEIAAYLAEKGGGAAR